uniref:Probable arginine--tRNA ligase, mitochondrial n=1 Tax=Eptatretus burgeri TaxID=7764 RepID=A0A8C4QSV7_EPTBU
MGCVFRREIAKRLSRVLAISEDELVGLIAAVPVKKGRPKADFHLPVQELLERDIIASKAEPKAIVENISRQVRSDGNICVTSAPGSAWLEFTIRRPLLAQIVLQRVSTDGACYGVSHGLLHNHISQKVVVEFSSPNIAKKFHAGHVRSTIIGNFLANLHELLGDDVIRTNYFGDWGLQFGLLGAAFQRFGSKEELEKNPLQHLFEVYVRINAATEREPSLMEDAHTFSASLEMGEPSALALWEHFRALSLENYSQLYKRLGVRFDEYDGESQYRNAVHEVVSRLRDQGLLQISEQGTGVVDISPSQDMSSYATVTRSDGSSLYLTRDLAAAIDRMQRHRFDRMYYVTDHSQELHFQQVFLTLQRMGHSWANRCQHVPFGRVLGMKTRCGDVVFLEDVLDEARIRALHSMASTDTTKVMEDPEETAEHLGLAAIIVHDFHGDIRRNYQFDWDRVLQRRGDTGVYLQYTHARLCSLEREQETQASNNFDPECLHEMPAIQLIQHLMSYDEALHKAWMELQPRSLVQYLLQLSRLVSVVHKQLPVKGSPSQVAQARTFLLCSARNVLACGLNLLGIRPVDRM